MPGEVEFLGVNLGVTLRLLTLVKGRKQWQITRRALFLVQAAFTRPCSGFALVSTIPVLTLREGCLLRQPSPPLGYLVFF